MTFQFSTHAQVEMKRRGIAPAAVDSVLAAPEQKVPEHGAIICYQSKVKMNRKIYLLRVMVNETSLPPVVVTMYRASRIQKYWRQP